MLDNFDSKFRKNTLKQLRNRIFGHKILTRVQYDSSE